jgi:hypothetical protein
LNVTLNARDNETYNVPVPEDVMFTSLKSEPFTVKLPVEVFNGVSARYAVPETSGAGNVPVDVKAMNTPVEGVIVTVGVEVYPVPAVTRFKDDTSLEATEIVPVAGVESKLLTVYVNVVAVASGIDAKIAPAAGVGKVDATIIVNVFVPVTVIM